MTLFPRRALLVAALGLIAAMLTVSSGAVAQSGDPAVAALTDGDAYVSPRALGPAARQAEATLAEAAMTLNEEGRDVKLAIVPGPVGSPSMRAYARNLRRDLGYAGTLAVTAPRRPTVAVGPLAPAIITTRLRSPSVAGVSDPIQRVIAAGELAAPEPEETGSTRQVLLLLGLGVLGAAWAVAWGLRRERRGARAELAEMRGWASVCLDAIDARARELSAAEALPDGARSRLESAEAQSRLAREGVGGADRMSDVDAALPTLREAFGELEAAAKAADEPLDVDDPFAGLCAVDPAHGRGEEPALIADDRERRLVCGACARTGRQGGTLERRKVPVRGRAVRFDQMPGRVLGGEGDGAPAAG